VHRVLKLLQFAFQEHVFDLMAIQVRLHLARRIDLCATAMTKHSMKRVIVEVYRRITGIDHFHCSLLLSIYYDLAGIEEKQVECQSPKGLEVTDI
jgi:hypothetical protein